MSIKIANSALNNCQSIDQVVELVNDNFATDASPEMIAAAYAVESANAAGYGTGELELECQLDVLMEAGAEFEFLDALALAKNN